MLHILFNKMTQKSNLNNIKMISNHFKYVNVYLNSNNYINNK